MEGHFDAVWTMTQNVDGLHRRAGSRNVLDVHGDLHDLNVRDATTPSRSPITRGSTCRRAAPECGGIVRPGVVLFGEELPVAKMDRLWSELRAGFDVIISVGTSSSFDYISAPVLMARGPARRPSRSIRRRRN